MNPQGHPATLVHEPGNACAVKHAVYSPRLREGRASELAEEVLRLSPVATPADVLACEELGSLLALAEAIDQAIADGGVVNPGKNTVRALIDLRLRTDRRIEAWVSRLGLDPLSRARVARDLAGGSLAAQLAGMVDRGDE